MNRDERSYQISHIYDQLLSKHQQNRIKVVSYEFLVFLHTTTNVHIYLDWLEVS